jgi:hypothetical protein
VTLSFFPPPARAAGGPQPGFSVFPAVPNIGVIRLGGGFSAGHSYLPIRIGLVGNNVRFKPLTTRPINNFDVFFQPSHLVSKNVLSMCRHSNAVNAIVDILGYQQRVSVSMEVMMMQIEGNVWIVFAAIGSYALRLVLSRRRSVLSARGDKILHSLY